MIFGVFLIKSIDPVAGLGIKEVARFSAAAADLGGSE